MARNAVSSPAMVPTSPGTFILSSAAQAAGVAANVEKRAAAAAAEALREPAPELPDAPEKAPAAVPRPEAAKPAETPAPQPQESEKPQEAAQPEKTAESEETAEPEEAAEPQEAAEAEPGEAAEPQEAAEPDEAQRQRLAEMTRTVQVSVEQILARMEQGEDPAPADPEEEEPARASLGARIGSGVLSGLWGIAKWLMLVVLFVAVLAPPAIEVTR